MKWRIKNPAPQGERLTRWGDYHFGMALKAALERAGQEVAMDFHPEWEDGEDCDVVLVLRGKRRHEFQRQTSGPLHALWVISHPDEVTEEEYGDYDKVFIASESRAREVAAILPGRVHALLQCTDTSRFHPRPDGLGEAERRDIVFVGNTRDVRRELIIAAGADIPLRIWGRGWRHHGLADHVVGDFIENEVLGDLYRAARISLNDHWPDMCRAGFINNRIFDALACGLPVLTDQHPAISDLFDARAVIQTTPQELKATVGRILLRYPDHLQAAREAAETIAREHSFDTRASELIAHLS
ncbi:MAG: CgeB family protein [Wenzhouxiangellaceae bacterium]